MKILIVLGGGGHTSQMLKLVTLLEGRFEFEYVVARQDSFSEKKIRIPGNIIRINRTRNIKENLFSAILKQIVGCFEAFFIISKSDAKAIIACGPHVAAPMCFICKLLGKKIIFLESWSRIYTKSDTGRFIYSFADLFFVQWPEMLKLYPKAVYAGRLA